MNVELNKTEINLIRNAIQTKIYALLKTAEDVDYPDVLTMRINVVLNYVGLDKKLTAMLSDEEMVAYFESDDFNNNRI